MYALGVHRQLQRQKLSNWIYFGVKLKTEELVIELVFFDGFELYVKFELFRKSYIRSES